MNSKSSDNFDQLADRYDSWFDRHAAVFQSELDALKKITPSSGNGLEIGVGSGRFAAGLGIKTGMDPSAKLREMAKSRGIHVYDGIAEALPFPDHQFDFVLLTTVLCFLTYPLKGLEEAKRVLKSEGILIIGMIDRESPLGQKYETRKHENPFYKHAHFYSVNEVLKMLSESGFTSKETYQTIFSPLDQIIVPEPVKSGHGEGGFVVIKAIPISNKNQTVNSFNMQQHWETIYTDKSSQEVSWFQAEPTISLNLIKKFTQPTARIIDVGGGTSLLVDNLLNAGYAGITVLDISSKAIEQDRMRLHEQANNINWVVSDITQFKPSHMYDLWHDRAVFHFLTEKKDRDAYISVLKKSIMDGGYVIIATFTKEGPNKCSGLDIVQYDVPTMQNELGDDFELLESQTETHITPKGSEQKFIYFVFKRI